MIYKVQRIDNDISYEEYVAFVIRAKDMEEATQIARDFVADSTFEQIVVNQISPDGEPKIIMSEFNAG